MAQASAGERWRRSKALATLGRVKIYTRTGDDGTTGVLGAERLLKSAPRVEAYGEVDELNATLGAVRALDAEGWLHAELDSAQRARLADIAERTPVTLTLKQGVRITTVLE